MSLFCNMLDVSAYNALVLWLSGTGLEPAEEEHLPKAVLAGAWELHGETSPGEVHSLAAVQQRCSFVAGAAPAQEQTKKKCHLCRGKRSVHARFCQACGQAVCKEHSTVVCSACSC
uniref:Uncharacterized protein n=2 Tax=Nothobranchius TaxID=28779 RepID=A0A1A8N3X0_9TELE